MSKSGGDGEEVRDSLVKDYGTVLRESALLTTFSGLLFGFLLNISILSAKQFTFSYRIIILIALFNIVVAMCMVPGIYHHIEFPYRDVTKFIRRSHRFILFGFLPTGMSLYLGMVLAFSQIINDYAFFVATLPFILVFVLYQMRKLG
jgi:hypothetical protein